MARRRPTYTAEFREEALRRVRNSDEAISSIARELGISTPTLRTWIAASRAKAEVPAADSERTELTRLRKENRELRMEREILKKATAFFAKYSE